jgi:spermidine/putrescine transport system substrate-binding protein
MYGTLGIMYDYSKTNAHIDSWSALFGSQYNNKRSIKESVRDAYAAACLYNAREELTALTGDALHTKVQEIFEDASDSTIASAKATLQSISSGAVWDVDNVKFEMAADSGDVQVALMWSCDAGYVMNDFEDDDEVEHTGNKNLWYVIPKEGGNVYIDAFVISKYAKNVEAANYFLAYLCTKDVAIANSEYIGAISPVEEAYDELYAQYTDPDFEMFEGVSDSWRDMYLEMMFPSAEKLNRCGVMKDFGDRKSAITRMWSSIR